MHVIDALSPRGQQIMPFLKGSWGLLIFPIIFLLDSNIKVVRQSLGIDLLGHHGSINMPQGNSYVRSRQYHHI